MLGSAAQRHRLLVEHRLDRLAHCLDVEAGRGNRSGWRRVPQHLQQLEMIVMMQRHAGADDFQKIHCAERPIALVRAQFAMIGMIDRDVARRRRPLAPNCSAKKTIHYGTCRLRVTRVNIAVTGNQYTT
jgi:hypothetical protein